MRHVSKSLFFYEIWKYDGTYLHRHGYGHVYCNIKMCFKLAMLYVYNKLLPQIIFLKDL